MSRFYEKLPFWVLFLLYGLIHGLQHLTSVVCCVFAWYAHLMGENGFIMGLWLMMAVITLPAYRQTSDE